VGEVVRVGDDFVSPSLLSPEITVITRTDDGKIVEKRL
jgi:hypothetical protein